MILSCHDSVAASSVGRVCGIPLTIIPMTSLRAFPFSTIASFPSFPSVRILICVNPPDLRAKIPPFLTKGHGGNGQKTLCPLRSPVQIPLLAQAFLFSLSAFISVYPRFNFFWLHCHPSEPLIFARILPRISRISRMRKPPLHHSIHPVPSVPSGAPGQVWLIVRTER
jgi:hypothetical protein